MKIVLIGYTGDRGNWGCQATSRKLVSFLQRTFPRSSVTTIAIPRPISLDRLHDHAHGREILETMSDPSPSAKQLALIEKLVVERHGVQAESLRHADLVVYQGEGSVGPSSHLRRATYVLAAYVAAKVWGRPVLSMNQSVYAADKKDGDALAGAMRAFRVNACREPYSCKVAARIGVPSPLLCPDLAFSKDDPAPTQPIKPPLAGSYFCVTGSALKDLLDPEAFARSVKAIQASTGLYPVFLASRIVDRDIHRRYFPDSPLFTRDDHPLWVDMKPLLAGAAFTFGGRYHTAVTSLTCGTPVILLPGNVPKAEGLGPLLGLEIPVFMPSETEAICTYAVRMQTEGPKLRLEILTAVEKVCQTQEKFAEFLREWHASNFKHAPSWGVDAFKFNPVPDPDEKLASVYHAANWTPTVKLTLIARLRLFLYRLKSNRDSEISQSFSDLP